MKAALTLILLIISTVAQGQAEKPFSANQNLHNEQIQRVNDRLLEHKQPLQQRLTSHTINLATSEWPPYVSGHLPGNGYIYQIVDHAFKNKNYNVHIEFMSWDDAINFSDQHKHEGFFPAYENETGSTSVVCSMSFDGGPIGLYRRKSLPIHYPVDNPGENQALVFSKLREYRFGVVQGYVNTREFDDATYLKKVSVANDYDNLKQLQEGKVDLIIIDIFVAQYYIENNPERFTDIEFMGPALENKKLYLCFKKQGIDYPQMLSDFNAALISMKASGELDKIISRYSR